MSNDKNDNKVENADLGLAGGLAKSFIQSPLSPLLFFALLLMGILGLIVTPRQEDPQISVPMIDVFVQYPGASTEEVSSKAVFPLERLMSEIKGVEHVYSASQRGMGIVTVQFYVGEKMGPSLVKLNDKLQSNMDIIPDGVMQPLVKPKGIDDVSVINITLWSKDADGDGIEDVDDSQLRVLAQDVLQKLKEIKDTGFGEIIGGRSEQIQVLIKPDRLSGFGISLDQVAQTIRSSNSQQSAGSREIGGTTINIETGGFIKSANDIEKLVVGTFHGSAVYVRDIADVVRKPEETNKLVTYYTGKAYDGKKNSQDGMPGVTIAIAKKEGTNGVNVANALLERMELIKSEIIPANIGVAVTRNYGATAKDKVDELILKLFKVTLLVFVLVFLAFRALKPALVVLLIVPVVILFTVFMAFLMGYTIDRVSLFALIFSIGILVDDAIVVVENIYRRWLEENSTDPDIACDAVREVGNPTILATFTVIAALLPMGFVRGMMGPYMEPIPALGSVAMLFSLGAAFIFTPWLAYKFKPSMSYLDAAEKREHVTAERLGGFYKAILIPLIDSGFKRKLFKTIMWGGLMATFLMFYTTAVKVKMLPLDNKPEFSVVINMPEGTALPVTANLAHQMASIMREIDEVVAIQTYVGTARPFDFNGMVRHYYLRQKPWQGELQIQLTHKNDRERNSHQLALLARKLLSPMAKKAGAKISVVEMPPGPPVLQTMVAEVYGPEVNGRYKLVDDITAMFEKAPNVTDVDNYKEEHYTYKKFIIDTEKASRQGISVSDINRNIIMAMGGFTLGTLKSGSALEQTKIVMQVPLGVRSQSPILNLPIANRQGTIIPLAELGKFEEFVHEPTKFRKDNRELEYVVGEVTGELAAPVYGMMQVGEQLMGYKASDGKEVPTEWLGPPKTDSSYGIQWAGEWTVTYETFRDMGLAFCVAMVLIYALVVWEFGNFKIPAIIMSPIPLTLLGIIPGHWIMGAEFTATSMIGWIALAGIIVRNSILLVDFSIHEIINKNVTVREAVLASCQTRTRPIVITALALVAGSIFIMSDPIFNGMAISLLFGSVVATAMTLIVIPLGCMQASESMCCICNVDEKTLGRLNDENQMHVEKPVEPVQKTAPTTSTTKVEEKKEAVKEEPKVEEIKKEEPKVEEEKVKASKTEEVKTQTVKKAAVKKSTTKKKAATKKKVAPKKKSAPKKKAAVKKKADVSKEDAGSKNGRRGIKLKED
jgi:multidrug efflux pump subunit AcrB